MNKAIVLFSGGLDSTTLLYEAKSKRFKPYCLIFDYGQRHKKEVAHATTLAKRLKYDYRVVTMELPWQGSSLLNAHMKLPKHKTFKKNDIPSTYVPARNTIFLSFAASYAETIGANSIFIGANAIDYSGYPDCRPEYFTAYQAMLKKALKVGIKGKGIKLYTPLLKKTKAQIIKMGNKLGVPYELTWSCYRGSRISCGVCDSCVLRLNGFHEAKIEDPLEYDSH